MQPHTAAADPYPGYGHLRDTGDVHLIREPTGLSRHTVFHYEHARDLLADERISKDPRNAWEQLSRAGYLTGDPETDQYIFHIANCDPPDHTRLRKLVQKAFTTRGVERLRPRARQRANELLSQAVAGEPVDLITGYAWPLGSVAGPGRRRRLWSLTSNASRTSCRSSPSANIAGCQQCTHKPMAWLPIFG
ncbi:cytochrome P450 [Phytohabitans suffuscus]|uniref:Cytochrome P450 n=1 Tax=Phytohabitans suffuscus TaxID=624315 RepID=A0A6F8YTF9_9ACTN|nr:cytochrome P450 [Phytohabitans suffuscus]BCB89336.1 hypothetical protein Psuf_066490 [Phytohabitans suffuscus]